MKKYLLATLCTGLAFVIAGVMVWGNRRMTDLERQVTELRQSALYQTAEEMNALALDLEKALLSTDAAQAAALLSHIGRRAESAAQCLSFLPVNTTAMTFVNQLADQADAMLPLAVQGNGLTPAQARQLERHLALCTQLCGQLALMDDPSQLTTLSLTGMPAVQEAPRQAKGLPQGEITQEEALAIARSFVGDERIISMQAAPGTTGTLAAYGVAVQTQDVQLNLEVTRQGGKILWMMPETASFPVQQSVQACMDAAAAFLPLHGFGSVEPVHHQVYDGLCVISFVPVQDGVLLYPDVLRVQVRMDNAAIVGLEAHSYWMNHVHRQLPEPVLSADGGRLCLLPHGGQEVLCYEHAITHEGETFLVYVDAQSGQEVDVLKTVQLESGAPTA